MMLFLIVSTHMAQAESMTLTTFYPSPSGDYKDLYVSGSLGVGTTAPVTNLDVVGTMRMKPRTGAVSTWAAGVEGQMAYSSVDHRMQYWNGTSWVGFNGSPCILASTHYSFNGTSSGSAVCPAGTASRGGGCGAMSGGVGVLNSNPTVTGWFCEGQSTVGMTVYAICCQ
ncbi:MAG: hypothetical protein V2A70_07175 [Candidatus Omnitrophota bacterium]